MILFLSVLNTSIYKGSAQFPQLGVLSIPGVHSLAQELDFFGQGFILSQAVAQGAALRLSTATLLWCLLNRRIKPNCFQAVFKLDKWTDTHTCSQAGRATDRQTDRQIDDQHGRTEHLVHLIASWAPYASNSQA